jgi:DNA-binding protein HU-beta
MAPKRRRAVNKSDMIQHIAQAAEMSKSAAERAVDALVVAVKTSLRRGEAVTLAGFGSFHVAKRAARVGRNPRTGAQIRIQAARVPRFRPGKALKDAIN